MTSRRLEWRHKGWTMRAFELVEGSHSLARLRQRGMGGWAELDVGGRRWRVETQGVLRWTIRVLDDTGQVHATFPMGWRGHGTITLADGRRFSWDAETFWRGSWVLDDEAKVQVARVKLSRFLTMDAVVDVAAHADLPEDDLVALLAVTWFALVVTTQAAVAAGGA